MSSAAQVVNLTPRGRLDGIKVIDTDTHVTEWDDLWTSRAPAKYKDRVPQVRQVNGMRTWMIDGDHPISTGAMSAVKRDGSKVAGISFMNLGFDEVHAATHDVKARLKLMDDMGIFAQIAYPNVLGFGGQAGMVVEPELRRLSTMIYNDAMAQMQAESGNRIYPMALLPWWDVKLAVEEAQRCHELGLRGVNINSSPHEHKLPPLGNTYWDPLWEVCEATGMPVNFHIGASDTAMGWFSDASWPDHNSDAQMTLGGLMLFVENLRVMANILVSRFLERHPKLKIVSVESGIGWIPYLLEALDYFSRESNVHFDVPIREIFRRQIYACSFFERDNLPETIRQVGAENVMFETDFPHPASIYPEGPEYPGAALDRMTQQEKQQFFSSNAAKVYNIDIS